MWERLVTEHRALTKGETSLVRLPAWLKRPPLTLQLCWKLLLNGCTSVHLWPNDVRITIINYSIFEQVIQVRLIDSGTLAAGSENTKSSKKHLGGRRNSRTAYHSLPLYLPASCRASEWNYRWLSLTNNQQFFNGRRLKGHGTLEPTEICEWWEREVRGRHTLPSSFVTVDGPVLLLLVRSRSFAIFNLPIFEQLTALHNHSSKEDHPGSLHDRLRKHEEYRK